MRRQTAFVSILTTACLLAAGAAFAAPADAQRGDLSELREKIRGLKDDISHGEASRTEVADDLADTEKAISSAQRKLHDIANQREVIETHIAALQTEQAQSETRLAALHKRLGDTVFRMYVEGGQSGARRFLSGDNPNQLARDAYYLEQIARQRKHEIDEARASAARIQALSAQAEAQKAQLVALENERAGEQARLEAERRKHRQVLESISGKLQSQRKEMASMQRDEARMEQLIRGLERIAREQAEARARAEAKAAAEAQARAREQAQAAARQSSQTASRQSSSSSAQRPTPAATAAAETFSGFSKRKGALSWPVHGPVKGRFGSARAEGGTNWHGIFIRSASGTPVRAIAPGKIVFADWMRGFGNLVIVDHGDGYMSVYGNNDSILRSTGDTVAAGDSLATVGSSGGQDESGLYFEIRYRGQPQDPARWLAEK